MDAMLKPSSATPNKNQPGAAGSAGQLRGDEHWSLAEQCGPLLHSAADQISDVLHALQSRLDQLQAQGKLAAPDQAALAVPVGRIKRLAGVMEQIQRFNAGRIRQSHERIDLAQLAESGLQERRKEFALIGVEMRRKLKPVEVLLDPSVTHTFFHSLVDWALPLGRRIDVRVDLNDWPPHARLQVRVHAEDVPSSRAPELDNLDWALLRQIAATTGGIDLQRKVTAESITATAMFHRTVQAIDGMSAVDLSEDPTSAFKSLHSVYALVVSPSLQIRADVRDALREIGVSADSVVDLQQAAEAATRRTPNIVVIDADLKGPEFEQFRRALLREAMDMPFVEISSDDTSFDMSGFGELSMAKVGRGNIRGALGTAVMFELAKTI